MLGDWLLYIRETSHEFWDLQENIKNFVIFTFSSIETIESAIVVQTRLYNTLHHKDLLRIIYESH